MTTPNFGVRWQFINAEDIVCTYLNPIAPGNVRPEMPNDAALPFIVVRRVAGGDDGVTDSATVQVDSFHNNRSAAYDLASQVHTLMLDIKSAPIVVNGISVRVDRVEHSQSPAWLNYQDENLRRFCARYRIETRITPL